MGEFKSVKYDEYPGLNGLTFFNVLGDQYRGNSDLWFPLI